MEIFAPSNNTWTPTPAPTVYEYVASPEEGSFTLRMLLCVAPLIFFARIFRASAFGLSRRQQAMRQAQLELGTAQPQLTEQLTPPEDGEPAPATTAGAAPSHEPQMVADAV